MCEILEKRQGKKDQAGTAFWKQNQNKNKILLFYLMGEFCFNNVFQLTNNCRQN